jgi:hypothetical protein
VFTARYALSPYIKQISFVFKGLIIGVWLSVFLDPDKHLQFLNDRLQGGKWQAKITSPDNIYVFLTANKWPNWKQIQQNNIREKQ